jgi:hypothetical protein
MKILKNLAVLLILPAAVLALPVSSPTPVPTAAPTATLSPAQPPKIEFSQTKFDFGTVDEGPDIVHVFHFHNSGKGRLVISSVGTSCGCTAAVEAKKEIPAGGDSVITATYHTQGRIGHATKVITVNSNDPVNPAFHLQLDMTVVREVDVQPSQVYFYNLQRGSDQAAEVRILGKPDSHLKILSAHVVGGKVAVSVKPLEDAPNHRYGGTLEVTVPKTMPIGKFTDEIDVKTDNGKKPDVVIPVQGEVVCRVQYEPKTLSFPLPLKTPMVIQFWATPPVDFAVNSASAVNHLVTPVVKKTVGANGTTNYTVEVTSVDALPEGSAGVDEVDITTTDPDQPNIAVPVTIVKP